MPGIPQCSVVIPHLRGARPLLATLHALDTTAIELDIVLVDNASTDGSVEEAADLFDTIRVIRSWENLGYAGGANLGLRHARAPWSVFLNDDAIPAPGAIESLVDLLETAGADDLPLLQPALRSSGDPRFFDYAGGAGGLMDRWGYPFALGRLFDLVEMDDGQYITAGPLAWASGCCFAGSTELLREMGGFEESFFAHFEEIDLCWRYRSGGGRIESAPQATVYHMGPSTLPVGGVKTYLNFRNNLWTLRRNTNGLHLFLIMTVRSILDSIAALRWLFKGRPVMAAATIRGVAAGLFRRPWRKAPRSGPNRTGREQWGVYQGSVVAAHYLRQVSTSRNMADRVGGWKQSAEKVSGS
ncbi:glycosyltransferase family 2 protein [Candidatus Zixiibacteriota bacterium]